MVPVAVPDILDDYDITGLALEGGRREAAAGSRVQPTKPAELAQARAFEKILQVEFAHLNELAAHLVEHRTPAPDACADAQCRDLAQLHERVEEVRHLLRALRDRFGAPE